MNRNVFRREIRALLVAAALVAPGLAAAEPWGPDWFLAEVEAEPGPVTFWDVLISLFLEDQAPPPGNQGSGEGSNGGGAMDPNGGGGSTGNPKPNP